MEHRSPQCKAQRENSLAGNFYYDTGTWQENSITMKELLIKDNWR